jgi:hypothetical protein
MKMLITVQNKKILVFSDEPNKKKINLLKVALEQKLARGRKAIKETINSLVSIEIVGCEAILHTYNESDSLALSLY